MYFFFILYDVGYFSVHVIGRPDSGRCDHCLLPGRGLLWSTCPKQFGAALTFQERKSFRKIKAVRPENKCLLFSIEYAKIEWVIRMRENKKQIVYDYIKSYIDINQYGPSVREICEAVGLSSTSTVHYYLRMLTAEGQILMQTGKKRAISLPKQETRSVIQPAVSTWTDRGSESRRAAGLEPLELRGQLIPVVGTVAAGQPILAEENVDGYLPWEGGSGWFALRVKGESMKNAGILPGDKVVIRPQQTAENGEIVVALLGDEATVKRFSNRNGHVWLLPENDEYEPIDGTEASVLGVVRGVVREYD